MQGCDMQASRTSSLPEEAEEREKAVARGRCRYCCCRCGRCFCCYCWCRRSHRGWPWHSCRSWPGRARPGWCRLGRILLAGAPIVVTFVVTLVVVVLVVVVLAGARLAAVQHVEPVLGGHPPAAVTLLGVEVTAGGEVPALRRVRTYRGSGSGDDEPEAAL
ncbi:hypothetical protein COO60DRAFT_907024 [Scenedesmus sp. NREL 46B-D3]|nr:hypothetical protein COO60DRAFT_907024 [Scenedesmus sp. NREL 46B-D3]